MNGNFICIKVKRTDGMSAVINVEAIDSICEEDGGVLITAGRTMHSVRCTLDEAIEAVTKNCSFLAQMPLLGFDDEPTEEIEDDAIEPEEAEHIEAEPAETNETIAKQEAQIADIVNDYFHSCHYSPRSAFFETAGISRPRLNDGSLVNDVQLKDDGTVAILTDCGSCNWSELPDSDRVNLLDSINAGYRFEIMHDWIGNLPLESYINLYNMTVDTRYYVLPNNEENLDRFGMTAGELLKSMVDGHYRKNDEYIFLSDDGELMSSSDVCDVIDCYELVDWALSNRELIKDIAPADVYSKVFE